MVVCIFCFVHKLMRLTNSGDDSKGYFIQPTVILTKNAKSITLVDEIFGPVVTVRYSPPIPPLRTYI
jgi:acyl-CoA reductase-like NAD-dependent aldehyde dehydrogenase